MYSLNIYWLLVTWYCVAKDDRIWRHHGLYYVLYYMHVGTWLLLVSREYWLLDLVGNYFISEDCYTEVHIPQLSSLYI